MINVRTLLAGPIARGALVSLAIRLVGIGLGVLQAILTARLLGPEGYGAVALVLSVASILATVALLGAEMLTVREVARCVAKGDYGRLHSFLRAIRLMVVVALLPGVALAALILPRAPLAAEFQSVMIYAALIFPLMALTLQNQAILRGMGQTALSQIPFQILRPIVLVGVLSVSFLTGLEIDPDGYLLTAIVGAALAMALAWLAARRFTPDLEGVRHPTPLTPLLRQSAPFFATSALGLLLAEFSTLMLAWWSTPEETGLFQPVGRIAPLLLIGAQAASVRYASRISEFWAEGRIDRIQKVTRLFTLTTTGVAVALAAIVIVFDEPLLGVFGPGFAQNTSALWVLAAAQVANAACGPVGMLLAMTDRAALAVWPKVLALILAFIVGYVTVADYGALGAAIAMGAGVATWNVLTLAMVWRTMKFDPSIVGAIIGDAGGKR